MESLPGRSAGLRGRHEAGRALRLEGRRSHPAAGRRASWAAATGSSTCAASITARAAATTRRSSGCATTTWSRRGPSSGAGIVGWYIVRITNPDAAPAIAKLIDEEFANSSSETRTQTESAFAASMVKQMGNIEFLILAIGSVVFFTLLLVTGNTMAISVRERTNELAVLKAIGYSDTFVLVDRAGRVAADLGDRRRDWPRGWRAMLVKQDLTQGMLLLYLPPIAFVVGAVIALATGFLAGVLPALSAMRLQRRRARCGGSDVAIPVVYNLRSVKERWTSSVVAVLGIAGTVAVFVAMLSLARGFKVALTSSGLPQNAIVQQTGADSEMTSAIEIAPCASSRTRRWSHARLRAAGQRGGRGARGAADARHDARRQRPDARRLASACSPSATTCASSRGDSSRPASTSSSSAATPHAPMRASTLGKTVQIGPGQVEDRRHLRRRRQRLRFGDLGGRQRRERRLPAPAGNLPVGDREAAVGGRLHGVQNGARARSAGEAAGDARAGVLRVAVAAGDDADHGAGHASSPW